MTSSPAASTSRGQTLFCVLKQLARRGSCAELRLRADGSREVAVLGEGTPHAMTVIPYVMFTEAQRHGWLVAKDGEDRHWVLSQAARQVLRRLKSAGEGRAASGMASASATAVTAPLTDPAESPLSWLRRHKDKSGRPLISAMQLEAGDRLRADFWLAEMTPRVTVNWGAMGGAGGSRAHGSRIGVDQADGIIAAQQRVRRALRAVGPVSADLLIDVCGHLIGVEEIERRRGWPLRSGKIALQMALSELARHYRLPGSDGDERHFAHRLRHWGADDYRPAIDPA